MSNNLLALAIGGVAFVAAGWLVYRAIRGVRPEHGKQLWETGLDLHSVLSFIGVPVIVAALAIGWVLMRP